MKNWLNGFVIGGLVAFIATCGAWQYMIDNDLVGKSKMTSNKNRA